jgi:pimeloyl-ACP methyl ester carboxylesterase
MRQYSLIFMLLSFALPMPPIAVARSHAIVSDNAYTHAQTLVDIDHGRRLNLYCTGNGSPTVVFDSGLGDSTPDWGLIQPAIAGYTRACSYDRAGLGYSDPAIRPGTSANEVDDLHRLLQSAGIGPPYLLVAHSLGGMTVRLYADDYPAEVAGMVLLDPSHEDMSRGFALNGPGARTKWDAYVVDERACVTTAKSGFVKGSERFKTCVPPDDDQFSPAINAALMQLRESPAFQQAMLWEKENVYDTSADQVRAARRSYGDMPLIVLSHSQPKGQDETQEHYDAGTKLRENLHDSIAALSTRGVRRTVPDSGHYIQFYQPQVVIDAILEALRAARTKASPIPIDQKSPH